jgi:hypothetical protein
MGPAVDIQRRTPRVVAKADRAVLMPGAGDRQMLSEIGVLRQQMRLATDMIEQMSEIFVSLSWGLRLFGV